MRLRMIMEAEKRTLALAVAAAAALVVIVVLSFLFSNHITRTYSASSAPFSIKAPVGYKVSDEKINGIPTITMEKIAGDQGIRLSVVPVPGANAGVYKADYELANTQLKLLGTSCGDTVNILCDVTYKVEKDSDKEIRFVIVQASDWEVAKVALESFQVR